MVHSLEEKYLHDAAGLTRLPDRLSGRTGWECPSNIALVKYWGKKPVQLPMNPSVSFTLQESITNLSVEFSTGPVTSGPSLAYFFEDQPNNAFETRFYQYLHQASRYLPFLEQMELVIHARNTFPHSAGIASSASSFGSLALSLCSIEQSIFGTLQEDAEFKMKASFLARLGSGSACRSVNGGFSIWGRTGACSPGTDEAAVTLNFMVNPVFQDYCDSILVIHSGEKAVSSSAGHRLMEHHPFFESRMVQAQNNLIKLLAALKDGDESGFIAVVEEEALTLHALMMTSRPGYLLLKPASLEVIGRIRQFRTDTGMPVSFTLDAGANVHLLYPSRIRTQVRTFIGSELSACCEQGKVIHDGVGAGPVKLH